MLYLLIAMSGYLLQLAFGTPFFSNVRRRQLLAVVLALSFVKIPMSKLLKAREFGRNTSLMAEALRGTDLRGKRLASNADYGASDIIAYYAGAQYIGQKRPRITREQVGDELRKARVDYYLVWGEVPTDSLPPGLSPLTEARVAPGNGGQTRLTVHRVN
jgi:hypothetical protein